MLLTYGGNKVTPDEDSFWFWTQANDKPQLYKARSYLTSRCWPSVWVLWQNITFINPIGNITWNLIRYRFWNDNCQYCIATVLTQVGHISCVWLPWDQKSVTLSVRRQHLIRFDVHGEICFCPRNCLRRKVWSYILLWVRAEVVCLTAPEP